jgi:hypothetical protein
MHKSGHPLWQRAEGVARHARVAPGLRPRPAGRAARAAEGRERSDRRYSFPSMPWPCRATDAARTNGYGVGVTPPVAANGGGAGTGGSMKAPRWGTTPMVLVSVMPTAWATADVRS